MANEATKAFMSDMKQLLEKHGVDVNLSADHSDAECSDKPQLVFSSETGIYIYSSELFMDLFKSSAGTVQ